MSGSSKRAQQIKAIAERKKMIEEFDAGQKQLQTELDNAPPWPVVQAAKEPGGRSNAGSDDLFGDSSAKQREKTDDSQKSRKKEP